MNLPGSAFFKRFIIDMGTENIKLVNDLENVIDDKEDDEEVPSLSKNIVS